MNYTKETETKYDSRINELALEATYQETIAKNFAYVLCIC
jgi:hypothetical protein